MCYESIDIRSWADSDLRRSTAASRMTLRVALLILLTATAVCAQFPLWITKPRDGEMIKLGTTIPVDVVTVRMLSAFCSAFVRDWLYRMYPPRLAAPTSGSSCARTLLLFRCVTTPMGRSCLTHLTDHLNSHTTLQFQRISHQESLHFLWLMLRL